jgi:hypothetical protein
MSDTTQHDDTVRAAVATITAKKEAENEVKREHETWRALYDSLRNVVLKIITPPPFRRRDKTQRKLSKS